MLNKNGKAFVKKYFQNFTYFYQRLGYKILVRLALNVGVGFLDGLGLAMFLPLLQVIDNANGSTATNLGNLSFILDGMQKIGLQPTLMTILLLMCLFFIFKGIFLFISNSYSVSVKQFFTKTIRQRLTNLMNGMSYKSFVLSDVGKIQNVLSAEVTRLSTAYEHYFNAAQQTIMVAVYMLFAFSVDSKFALLICLGGGLTSLIFSKIYTDTQKYSEKLSFETNFYQGLIIQYVNSFKYLKATGLLTRYSAKLLHTIEHIEHSNNKIGKLGAIVSSTREPVLIIIVSTVILIQVILLDGTLSTILVSLLFFYRALTSLMIMQTAYNGFLSVVGSINNVTSFEKELVKNQERTGKTIIQHIRKSIVLKDATFYYDDRPTLKNINIEINKNQTVAFVGESGSGKTTLVNILAGLIPLNRGRMLVDNIDRNDLNIPSYQKRVGYITQDPVIFNDTIFNNIVLWDEPSEENRIRFKQAIKKASLLEFIESLSAKEATILGNNGINLSGGQRQRISIARELYKNVDLLILDEATSALDSETEKNIQQNIEELHGLYTILIVAHRLSTIKKADLIVVMNQGEIAEIGTFEDLIIVSKKFKRMVELQEL